MKKEIIIIDYGMGNILSLKRALEYIGASVVVTKDNDIISKSSHIILPGVGAFPKAMETINKSGIGEAIRSSVKKGNFLLGICLGMQLLLTDSEEFLFSKGLDLISGNVKIISKNKNIKIPHVGWSNLKKLNYSIKFDKYLFKNINKKDSFYFTHSFMCFKKKNKCLYYTNYSNIKIPAVINSENIFGFQFHPEKSGKAGLILLENFKNI